MKVYTVEGTNDMEVNPGSFVEVNYFYGVFSSRIEADRIANRLRENTTKNNGLEEITVRELTLDEPTEDYFMEMSN